MRGSKMALLNVSNLTKLFGDELLMEGVSFQIDEKDKIGLVGANGTGKSSLFKMLTGDLSHDSGDIFFNKFTKIGYLEQYVCADSDKTVEDEMAVVFEDIIEIEHELEDIREKLEAGIGDTDALISRQTALNERLEERGGFYYKSRIRSALLGLGFSEDEFSMKISALSGGQKTRLALARILLSDSNLLLLDEPTNHLDIQSVEWLEDFLKSYKGAFVVISHDRYFLDNVTDRTFVLEAGNLGVYSGSYSVCLPQIEIERKTRERRYENTVKEIKRLEAIVEQQKRWNREKNIKTAESKQKTIDRLEKELDRPPEPDESMSFRFHALEGGGNDVIQAEGLSKKFDDKLIFQNADLHIMKGERIFIIGANGCGKTTLLKILLGQIKPSAGDYRIGANIKIGYYDQLQQNLNPEKTVIDDVWDEYPEKTQTEIRSALAAFLFRGEDVFKEISSLSGGERARCALAKLMLERVNLLIMDEPTNHLDIQSREALEEALAGYDGTLVMVSHDRYFINKTASRILYLDKNGIESYSGNYDYYLEKRKSGYSDKSAERASADKSDKILDYKERKQRESEKRKTINRFKKTEAEIAELEDEISRLKEDSESFATDFVKLAELASDIEKRERELSELYESWDELQAEIDEKGYDI